jgi:hypothetical protein
VPDELVRSSYFAIRDGKMRAPAFKAAAGRVRMVSHMLKAILQDRA